MAVSTYLRPILERVRWRLDERRAFVPLPVVVEKASARPATLSLNAVLHGLGIQLIAEVKRASPSKGPLNLDLNVTSLARAYEASGAAAISVLTEGGSFHGSLLDLHIARAAVGVPLLRKDFIVDPYQVWEARAWGADAVLLIVAILSAHELNNLLAECQCAGLEALVEVHDERELEQALAADAQIIGINNRDLRDFTVSLDVTERISPLVPAGRTLVSESGIRTRADVERLEGMGVKGVLVGETLVTAPDPATKIKELLGR